MDHEAIDLVTLGFIEFGDDGTGEFGFIAVRVDGLPPGRARRTCQRGVQLAG